MNDLISPAHAVTFFFVFVETTLLGYQLHYLSRPHQRRRLGCLVLLCLLLLYNLVNSLWPDPASRLDMRLQYIIVYGSAYLMGAFFPVYFYKACRLDSLKFHVRYGIALFLLLPYLLFDVLVYWWNDNLVLDRQLGVICPFIYGLVLLRVIYWAIRRKYKKNKKRGAYFVQLAVWAAILPWQAMTVFAFWNGPEGLKAVMANLGLVVVAVILTVKEIRHGHWPTVTDVTPETFLSNCSELEFTEMETKIGELLRIGLNTDEIADKMFKSDETVKKQLTSMYKKAGVKSRAQLLHRLHQKKVELPAEEDD